MPGTETTPKQTIKPAEKPRADQLISEYEEQRSMRRTFESYWQTLHDYFYIESEEINRNYTAGNELYAAFLWDATTLETSDVFASGFMNYLTPPASKWASLRHRDPKLQGSNAVGNFLEEVMDEVNYALNRSNFYDQMFPTYKASGVYGTAVLFEEEDLEDDVRFFSIPLKQVIIVENYTGRVAKYFIEYDYTPSQAAERWGKEKLSSELQHEIAQGKGDVTKHRFLLYIAERHKREIQKSNKENLPIEGTWIELKARTIVDESGYNEFPIFTHRFDKRPYVPWGYSPAMKALPFARILNAAAKTNLRTMMKSTDPAIAIPHNSFMAPMNLNPRGINYYDRSKMDGKDIYAFGNFGNPQTGLAAIEYYSQKVKTLMYHDTFLAFSNITKDMNNPEIMERINEKMTLLGPAVGRYLDEVISPIIQRTIGVLFRKGRLPELPFEMQEDPGFEIDFVGQLALAQKRTELTTIATTLQVVGNLAQFAPEVIDKIDTDAVVEETWAITGAPAKILRDNAQVKEIREARVQAQEEQEEMQNIAAGAQVAKDAGQAQQAFKDED